MTEAQPEAQETVITLAGDQALPILQELPSWGPVTTIVLHGGCVFEYKGHFPEGELGHGFYNLKGKTPGAEAGFEGHLNLELVDHIAFQDKLHRGRQSYALVFNDENNTCLFKVFLGRDSDGEILTSQQTRFAALMQLAQRASDSQ